ncbi:MULTISPECIES: 5'-methylthioadenosine/adenosylhomocysteine nucleosidase [Bacillus]|uniref:5'-methylthioadenosine/adenosylhomocysteine nucleosidase n=1 Tax=Bacillus TaxID=1386 RepID=UPI000944BFD9|nr:MULTISPECIES: 5'-methylthioadenosine/adenosylhomocysteine nucleosidase [Bacillus]MCU5222742.1 5'-methylthioadenosine/adenosylhomocysteine nucleosidase [Bacillus tropicus]MDA1879044.1 5'-methylthioadenosine/adenosylhomocysteine nucleosidase [Bacillus cereus group sp. BY10-2LC]MDV5066606.1 5'-methylthioadenosine/adenosylhomocysteine nucleosidase [Bacillus sp. W1]
MKFGIIGPSEDEIMPFIEEMTDKEITNLAMLTFYSGKYENVEVVALYCGVCKVNAAIATQILIDKFDVTHIIVTGVAGAIDKVLKIGDTVISTEIAYHDVDEGILTEYHPWMESVYFKTDSTLLELSREVIENNQFIQNIYFGKVVTGEAFISESGRVEIISKYNPLCVDMETASIAHVCYANTIPFLAVRSITDTEEASGIEVFEDNCVSASHHSIHFVKKLLEVVKK